MIQQSGHKVIADYYYAGDRGFLAHTFMHPGSWTRTGVAAVYRMWENLSH